MSESTPVLHVLPERPLADERLSVRVTGLRSGQRIEIVATTVDAGGLRWRANASFIAGRSGAVDLARQSPLWGDYERPDTMGLIWSMRGPRPGAVYADPVATPQATSLDVRSGGASIAGARVDRAAQGPGVERIEVRDEGLVGSLYSPASGPAPGVLVLADATEAVPERTAALLASHGFTALALAYTRARHLSGAPDELPLEYFERAMGWLLERRSVAGRTLAVLGTGRAAELAQLLTATFPAAGAVGAVAAAGERGTSIAWSFRGRPVAPVHPGAIAKPALVTTAGDAPFAPPFRPTPGAADAAAGEATWRRLLAFLSEAGPAL